MKIHSSLTKLRIDRIFKVIDDLVYHGCSVVNDECGITEIIIRPVLHSESDIVGYKSSLFVTSANYTSLMLDEITVRGYDEVVGIGNVSVIDVAKQLSFLSKKKLVIIPCILSNDSFCTNRVTAQNTRSWSAAYPDRVIIDLPLILETPKHINSLGIGEFIGLYSSYMDYCVSYNEPIVSRIISFISDSYNQLVGNNWSNNMDKLRLLAACLIFKCLIMRFSDNHQIGCGIDHSLAKALETMYDIPHGFAVFWGCAISMALFPHWSNPEFSLSTLRKASSTLGHPIGFAADHLVTNLESIIDLAREIRPLEISCINGLSNNQISKAKRILWDTLS